MKFLLLLCVLFSQVAFSKDVYVLPTKIGGHVFEDIMTINESSAHFGAISGTIEVPGAFKAPFTGSVSTGWTGRYYSFSIIAKENGTETLVKYAISVPFLSGGVRGLLTLEDGSVLGQIRDGKLISSDNQ